MSEGLRLPPDLAARYEAVEVLGQGAFGRVVLCEDRALTRRVAVKLMHAALVDPANQRRFEREARVTARVRDPHCVVLLDHGLAEGGAPYLVYEYVPGRTLRGALAAGRRWHAGPLADLGMALAGALAAAHREDVVHRDVKPENVILRGERDPVLCDFGLAFETDGGTRFTTQAAVLGTPTYIAPELWEGETPSPASDQFSLGATLYEVAFGARCFTVKELIDAVSSGARRLPLEFPPAARRDQPELVHALERALAYDPRGRFDDLEAFRGALERVRAFAPGSTGVLALRTGAHAPLPRRTLAHRSRWPAMALAAPLLCAAGVALLLRSAAVTPPPAPPLPDPREALEARVDETRRDLETHFRALVREHLGREELVPPSSTWDHMREVADRFMDPRLPLRWGRYLDALRAWMEAVEARDGPGAFTRGAAADDLEILGVGWGGHVLADLRRLSDAGPGFHATETFVHGREDLEELPEVIDQQLVDLRRRTELFLDALFLPRANELGTPRLLLLGTLAAQVAARRSGEILEAVHARAPRVEDPARAVAFETMRIDLLRWVRDRSRLACDVRLRVLAEVLGQLTGPPRVLPGYEASALLGDAMVEAVRAVVLCPQEDRAELLRAFRQATRWLRAALTVEIADPIEGRAEVCIEVMEAGFPGTPPADLAEAMASVRELEALAKDLEAKGGG